MSNQDSDRARVPAPNQPTRRSVLSAAAALSAAVAVPSAALSDTADAELLALWPRYVAAYRACDNIPENDGRWTTLNEVEGQIFALPPRTLAGAQVWLRLFLLAKYVRKEEGDRLLSGRPLAIPADHPDYDFFDRVLFALTDGEAVELPASTSLNPM